jgi:predicted Zn-ribbon and HTH transcriptional regulator
MGNEYWPAKCRACGWRGSSEHTNGGMAIADTGDFSELRCPHCDSTLIDDADEEFQADADEPMTVGDRRKT